MTVVGRVITRQTSIGYVRVIGADRIAICSGASTDVVDWDDLVLVRSAKNHTWMITLRASIRVRRPLQCVVEALTCLGLVQIHRRVAINPAKVRRLIRSGNRRLVVVLENELSLAVGRKYQRIVRATFGAKHSEPPPAVSAPEPLA